VVAAVAPAALAEPDSARDDPAWRLAMERSRAGDPAGAAEILSDLARRYPSSAAVAFQQARMCRERGDFDCASEAASRAITLAPGFVDALYLAGIVAEARGSDLAAGYFEQVIGRTEDLPDAELDERSRELASSAARHLALLKESKSGPAEPGPSDIAVAVPAAGTEDAQRPEDGSRRWWRAELKAGADTNPAYVAQRQYSLAQSVFGTAGIDASAGLDLVPRERLGGWIRADLATRLYPSSSASDYSFAGASIEGGAWARTDPVEVAIAASGGYSLLGWSPFLDSESLAAAITLHESPSLLTRLRVDAGVRHAWKDTWGFLGARTLSAAISQRFETGPWRAGLGLAAAREWADDYVWSGTSDDGNGGSVAVRQDWNASFFEWGPTAGAGVDLPRGLTLDAWVDVRFRSYDHRERFSWTGTNGSGDWSAWRSDTRFIPGAALSVPLGETLRLRLAFELAANDSDVGASTSEPVDRSYSRALVFLGLAAGPAR